MQMILDVQNSRTPAFRPNYNDVYTARIKAEIEQATYPHLWHPGERRRKNKW
jgi:hypothetical protein